MSTSFCASSWNPSPLAKLRGRKSIAAAITIVLFKSVLAVAGKTLVCFENPAAPQSKSFPVFLWHAFCYRTRITSTAVVLSKRLSSIAWLKSINLLACLAGYKVTNHFFFTFNCPKQFPDITFALAVNNGCFIFTEPFLNHCLWHIFFRRNIRFTL